MSSATLSHPSSRSFALCSPDVLDALDDTLEQAHVVALLLCDAAPPGGAGALNALRALLDGATGLLEALQTHPVNLAPANA